MWKFGLDVDLTLFWLGVNIQDTFGCTYSPTGADIVASTRCKLSQVMNSSAIVTTVNKHRRFFRR